MNLSRTLLIAVAAINIALAATAWYVVAAGRSDHEDKARLHAAHFVHLIAQDVENDYEKSDLALQVIADDHARIAALGAGELEQWLNRTRARHPSFSFLSIADASGEVFYGPELRKTFRANIADRAYFQRLRDDPQAGLQISEPLLGRISGEPVVVLARRLKDASGRFVGVALASIQIAYLRHQFEMLKLGPHDTVALRDPQLRLIARQPAIPGDGKSDVSAIPPAFRAALASAPNGGFYESGSDSIDGIDRSHAYLRNPVYGFTVSVGLARDDYLADWRTQARLAAAFVLTAALLSLLLATYLGRAWRAQQSARAGLQASEARFRAFFDNSMIGMAITSPEHGWLMVNPALCNFFGYRCEQLLTKTWAELTHPDDSARDAAELARVVAGEIDGYSLEKRFIRSDGRIVQAFVAARAVRHSDGSIESFSAIVMDIDERKRAERDTRDALAMLRRFLDHFPGLAYLKDADRRVLMANGRFQEILGFSADSVLGKNNREMFPDEFGDKIDADDRRILASGKTEIIEERLGAKVLETHKFAIDSEDGKRLLGGVTIDITLKHRVAERYRTLLEINELDGSTGEQEFLTRGLEMAERITGSRIGFLHFVNDDQESIELVTWTAGALSDCAAIADQHYPVSQAGIWADCIRRQAPAIFNDYAGHADKKGLPEGHTPLTRLISVPVIEDGRVRLVLAIANKNEDYDDFDVGTVQLIGNDLWRIARRMRLETQVHEQLDHSRELNRKLEQTQNQLLQSEKMAGIGQLAAGVAHELNNPIGFIQSNIGTLQGYVDDLLEVLDDCEQCVTTCELSARRVDFQRLRESKDIDFIKSDIRQLLVESKEGTDRVRRIVQNLKDFSHVSEDEWSWADLHQGLDSTLTIAWHEIKYKAEVEKRYGDLPAVHCVPAQLNQVFMNLLVNAAHAIEEKGRIVIASGSEGDGGRVWIEISDTGKGIAPENLGRIFEPFFTTKPIGQGTGLGLSLAWGIIEKHHGRLSVDSKLGIGTTFRIELPVDGAPPSENPT